MNWEFLMSFALAFGLLFVIFMTIGFYISYKRDRNLPKEQISHDPKRGRYFKRFIPESLKAKYEDNSSRREYLKEAKYYRRVTRTIVMIPLSIFVIAAIVTWKRYGDYMYAAVRLEANDIEKIKLTPYDWVKATSGLEPNIEALRAQFLGRRIVLIGDGNSADFSESVRSAIQRAENSFQEMGRMFNVPVKNCEWRSLATCQPRSPKNIYVVLPGKWDESQLDGFLKYASRILFIGPPRQAFESSTGGWSWRGLAFRRAERGSGDVLVRGDQISTIGLQAGELLNLPAVDTGFEVEAEQTQAYRMREDRKLSSAGSTAWSVGREGDSKWVWIDFVPDLSSANTSTAQASQLVLGGIFRYLFDVEFQAVATWPNAMMGAAIIVADVIGNFELLDTLLEKTIQRSPKISFFVVSKAAERKRSITQRFLEFGEVNCISNEFTDLSTSDLKKQTLRLAECKKAISEVTRFASTGAHPPFENYNSQTLSAAYNAGFSFFISGLESQFSPLMLMDKSGQGRLVQLPRGSRALASQSTIALNNLDLSVEVANDMAWARRMNGLYVFNFGDVVLEGEGLNLIGEMLGRIWQGSAEVSDADVLWRATASEVDRWWRVRENLLKGVAVSDVELNTFRPAQIKVTAAGEMSVIKFQPKTEPESK